MCMLQIPPLPEIEESQGRKTGFPGYAQGILRRSRKPSDAAMMRNGQEIARPWQKFKNRTPFISSCPRVYVCQSQPL